MPPAEPRAVDARKSRPVFAEQVEELMDRHRAEPGRGYDVKAFEIAERARTDGLADIFGARPEPLSLREIQRGLLDRDTLLLDYFLGERQSTLWVVSSTSMSAYALPPCSTIEDAARKTYALLARGYIRESAVRLDLALSSLGEMLLGPVEGQLAGKTLIV
ncbi:MAG TPA: hypothetical protein VKH20_01720, partial [Solirubrobacterales bacterium]|nr:hypothetical protein [Solirubrobacterales bacterium]